MQKFNIGPVTNMLQNLRNAVKNVSDETLGWLAVVILHSATIPSMLAYSHGLSNDPLPIDMVLLVWTGLMLLFVRAAVRRDMLNLITIGVGFAVHAGIMALTLFK
jgi:hypothetical protein